MLTKCVMRAFGQKNRVYEGLLGQTSLRIALNRKKTNNKLVFTRIEIGKVIAFWVLEYYS